MERAGLCGGGAVGAAAQPPIQAAGLALALAAAASLWLLWPSLPAAAAHHRAQPVPMPRLTAPTPTPIGVSFGLPQLGRFLSPSAHHLDPVSLRTVAGNPALPGRPNGGPWLPAVAAWLAALGTAVAVLAARWSGRLRLPQRLAPVPMGPLAPAPVALLPLLARPADPVALPPLPYARTALEPHISAETLDFHYGKHHRAYVTRLNELLHAMESGWWRQKSLEDIVRGSTGTLYNQAAQVWNHNFYWRCLRPNPTSAPNEPRGALRELIEKQFGSLAQFREQFTAACVSHFGSGWVWLAYNKGQLDIVQGHDADNLLKDPQGREALLTCDVWEHAYYVDRFNARAAYVAAWWHLVDWGFVGSNLAHAQRRHTVIALSALEDVALGGFAGAMACAAGMPLLTLKFCSQAGQPLPTAFLEWYRGVAVQALSAAPVAAFQMCANGMMARVISGSSPLSPKLKRELSGVERILAAAAAGICSALLYTPVDLLTIQQQRLSQNLAGAFMYIVSKFGPMGLLHGAMAMSIRECVFVTGMFGLTPIISEALVKRFDKKGQLTTVCRLIGSIFAGIFAAVVTQPVDTVKTCIQADIEGVTYRNVWQAVALVARERGWASLYQGMVPRTCLLILSFFVTTLLKANAERLKTNRHFRRQLEAEGASASAAH